MNCSVVIPVYRGEETLEPLIGRLGKVLSQVAEAYEVVLVNDGSPDHSWEIIGRLAAQHDWVRGIALMRNYGQENATLCGIRAARYDVIVIMDDDLQHNPEDLPKLVNKLNEGFDVVYGVPRTRRQTWWKSIFATLVKSGIASIIGLPAIRYMSSYKAFRASLKPAFAELSSPDVQIDVLLSWGTTRFAVTQIEEATRKSGRSNYNINKLIKVSLLILTNYTTVPLRIASILGFLFTILGVFVLIYVVGEYFTVGSIPGFSFLASAITIFSGVQLFALGIIGEYLARMFERTSGKQPYIVMKTTGAAE
jgi:glycosyltransferase involved in cell wall biosynthesis